MGDELVIVSRCLFGGYSPFVKNVIDRSISYVQPFFDTSVGDMRHKSRYSNKLKLRAVFYGEVDEMSKETAKKLVAANARNLRAEVGEISFFDDDELNMAMYITGLREAKRRGKEKLEISAMGLSFLMTKWCSLDTMEYLQKKVHMLASSVKDRMSEEEGEL